MDLEEKLLELGMMRLDRKKEVDGFTGVVVNIIAVSVRDVLYNNLKLTEMPELAVIRHGKILGSGTFVSRCNNDVNLSYSLLRYDWDYGKFKIISDSKEQRCKNLIHKKGGFYTGGGTSFTTKRHFDKYKNQR